MRRRAGRRPHRTVIAQWRRTDGATLTWLTGLGALVVLLIAADMAALARPARSACLATAGVLMLWLGSALLVRIRRRFGATPLWGSVAVLSLVAGGAVVSQRAVNDPANAVLDSTLRRVPALASIELTHVFDAAHVATFSTLALLSLVAHRRLGTSTMACFVGAGLFALAIEAVQLHLPDRRASLGDLRRDLVGLGLGTAVYCALLWWRGPRLRGLPSERVRE